MNKKFTSLLVLLFSFQIGMAQATYDKIRIWSDNTNEIISELQVLGIDPEGFDVRPGVYVDAIVSQYEKLDVESLGFATEELILDLSAYYASRLSQGASRELGYGSMGGYLTFNEIVNSMDSLHADFPEIVSAKMSIGQSYEGRDIWAFKISDAQGLPDGDPQVLYTSLIHAREPAAMMTLMHFAWSLAEEYNQDPTMTYLVNEREIWFVPVINPDGYVYNELTDPGGGGMHRKNRHPGCTSSPGVDLNRNWGFQWGFNDEGSSPDPCNATYRGTAPFSEPETQVMSTFVLGHDFKTIFNYHSYGNLLIKPFGYDESVELPSPDIDIYAQMGPDLVEENDYLYGTGTETVGYTVNGDAVDYMYGELGIINFTPEVGAGSDGAFWPPTELIFEMAEGNIDMNIHLAGCAGSWIEVENFEFNSDGPLESGEIVGCELGVMNKGLGSEDTEAILYLHSPDSSITPSQSSLDVSGLASQAYHDYGTEGLSFEINSQYGELAQLVLSIEMSGYETQVDTLEWIVGVPDTIFFDDFETGTQMWSSGTWGLEIGAGGEQYLTDSPSGDYQPDAVSTVFLNVPLDLRGYSNPILRFDASWDIEFNWDFCQVLASDDSGANWVALGSQHTDIGNGSSVQPLGEPGYHGTQAWIADQVSLENFSQSSSLMLAFELISDTFYEGNGFQVDNFTVLGWGSGFMLGDVTQDGEINVSDAVFLLESIISNLELDADLAELADTNQDSLIDVRDLVILVELILEQ
ncbi:MAG: immune inhibitor A [FCB group bacterium]|nr:immune inhibitor A [FCB group bacterium]MBL7028032.1 immune inhibitor A [Candidatus Neomarinimicrobiota bacterium]MBL7122770.1 immune inhibitor A [Candidatus Neomarinimicrobiota bacterium]